MPVKEVVQESANFLKVTLSKDVQEVYESNKEKMMTMMMIMLLEQYYNV